MHTCMHCVWTMLVHVCTPCMKAMFAHETWASPASEPPLQPPSTACDGDAQHIPLVQEWRRLKREWAALDVQVCSAPLSGGANGANGGGGLALRKMARADVYKCWKAADNNCTELLLNPKCTARWPTLPHSVGIHLKFLTINIRSSIWSSCAYASLLAIGPSCCKKLRIFDFLEGQNMGKQPAACGYPSGKWASFTN